MAFHSSAGGFHEIPDRPRDEALVLQLADALASAEYSGSSTSITNGFLLQGGEGPRDGARNSRSAIRTLAPPCPSMRDRVGVEARVQLC